MPRRWELDRTTAQPGKTIGDIAEELATQALERNGFTAIGNINRGKNNYKYADLVAEEAGTLGQTALSLGLKRRRNSER